MSHICTGVSMDQRQHLDLTTDRTRRGHVLDTRPLNPDVRSSRNQS